jgi:polar amino acid transport system permease protein
MQDLTQIDVANADRRRYPGQWVATVVVVILGAAVVWLFASNPTVQWPTVFHYLVFASLLQGLWTTVWLTVASMAIGIVGGVILAAGRMSPNWLVKRAADTYVWFFRGTPALVQLIFWFNIAIFLPRVKLGIPGGFTLWSASTNSIVKPAIAALLGLALNEAAYMCEVVRGGLLSVPQGQTEAAQSLGLSSRQTFVQIVLPQAMRAIVPPTGNQVINMLKGTSLVSVLAVSDLFYSAQSIYVTNGKIIPLLIVACIWYLIITSVLYVLQSQLERRFARGVVRRHPARDRAGTAGPAALAAAEDGVK